MPSAPTTGGRHCVQRAIAFEEGETAEGPWARVAFESVAGEAVALHVHAAGQPSAERGGFSDPGDHARHGSLPLMWRGRSALAAECTEVTFDGIRHDLPILVDRRPYFLGMHGFFTRQHWMGIVRAGVTEQAENALSNWTETDRSADTVTLKMVGDETQTVRGVWAANRFRLSELQVAAAGCDVGMNLIIADDRFSCAIDGTLAVVEGRLEYEATEDSATIRLVPETPAWAERRAVRVVALRSAQGWRISTTVG